MHAEIEAHFEALVERKVAAGMDPREARYATQREFGGIDQLRERCREQKSWSAVDRLLAECAYSVRRAAKNPGFTLIAIATLALCLGANFVIFSVVDSVLLRPLPFPQEEELVTLYDSYYKGGLERNGSSLTSYYERRGTFLPSRGCLHTVTIKRMLGVPGKLSAPRSYEYPPIFSTFWALVCYLVDRSRRKKRRTKRIT